MARRDLPVENWGGEPRITGATIMGRTFGVQEADIYALPECPEKGEVAPPLPTPKL